jgi:DNA-binding CsgD family transcriptional regulator
VRRDWPLVGRAGELSLLCLALRRADARCAVVAGGAGVGRTRLARAALAEAEARGHTTTWVVASQAAASVPLGAFAALLPPSTSLPASRLELLHDLAAAITGRGGTAPTVLGVDDAHLLDDTSAALVHQLVTTGAAFVLMTIREDQPAPDAVTTLLKDDDAVWVELRPLRRDEVADLVLSVLDGPVDPAVSSRIWDLSQGNALFCTELLEGALDSGAIALAEGRWRLRAPLSVGARLGRLVGARLEALDQPARAAAEVVALGEPLPLTMLDGLVDPEDLAAAEEAEVIVVTRDLGDSLLRTAHPLLGALLRERTAALRARTVRLALADAAEGTDASRAAVWRLDAGERPDAGALLTAAAAARSTRDYQEATRLALAAVAAGAGPSGYASAAEALMWQGDTQEARALFDRAEQSAPDDRGRVSILVGRAATELLSHGHLTAAERTLDRALPLADVEGRASIASLRGMVALDRGDAAAALAAADAWRDAPAGSLGRLHALPIAVTAQAWAGRPVDAVALGERAAGEASAAAEHPYLEDLVAAAQASALLLSGSGERAAALAERRHRQALDGGDEQSRARWAFVSGNIALHRGVLGAAVDRLEEAAALLAELTSGLGPGARAQCAGNLGEAYALAGDLEAAEASLAVIDAQSLGECWHPETGIARAWVLVAGGDHGAAAEALAEVGARAGQLGAWTFAARAWHDLARLGRPEQAVARLAELAGRVQGRLPAAWSAHSAAVAAGDATGLEASGARFVECGLPLLAAEAFAEAASAHRDADRPGAALTAAAAAAQQLEACGGATTPALQRARQDLPITQREREVATLAATGMATRQIADRLSISARTVENHLYRAYLKLGVHQRGDLTAVLSLAAR